MPVSELYFAMKKVCLNTWFHCVSCHLIWATLCFTDIHLEVCSIGSIWYHSVSPPHFFPCLIRQYYVSLYWPGNLTPLKEGHVSREMSFVSLVFNISLIPQTWLLDWLMPGFGSSHWGNEVEVMLNECLWFFFFPLSLVWS